jgi:hypothetical protein
VARVILIAPRNFTVRNAILDVTHFAMIILAIELTVFAPSVSKTSLISIAQMQVQFAIFYFIFILVSSCRFMQIDQNAVFKQASLV